MTTLRRLRTRLQTGKGAFAILALSLFMVALGARWTAVDRFGTDLPELDQWDAEGLYLLLPWFKDQPMLPVLFAPHNEHYVVLTKLLALGLTLANGQWDQRLECVVNAFIPAAIAVAFLLWTRRFCSPRFTAFAGIFLAAAWGLPFAWENVVSGFHSQQYFLLGLAFASIAWLPFAPFGSPRWFLGAAAVMLSLLTMASGLLAAAIVIGVIALRWLLRETTFRAALPAVLVSLAVVATGWLTRHEVDYHASLRATTFNDFFVTIIRGLQWPAPFSPWLGLLVWLPWTALAVQLVRNRNPSPARIHGWIIFGLGAWVCLQIIATAYARGHGGPPPASRYLDTLILGCCTNLLALGWLARLPPKSNLRPKATAPTATWSDVALAASLQRTPAKNPAKTPRFRVSQLGVISLLWLSAIGWGAYVDLRPTLEHELPHRAMLRQNSIASTRAYLASGDIAALQNTDIPYPGAHAFAERLAHPELVRLLPDSVRPPQPGDPTPPWRGFLSAIASTLARNGLIIAIVAFALLAASACWLWTASPRPTLTDAPREPAP